MRESGILLPISSLSSQYGIGCFSKEAYEFVDQLALANQKYWQILPLGPTSYGDSPYQSFSTYAGNPYFIDLEILCREKLLKKAECESFPWGSNPHYVDYGVMYNSRYALLKKAFVRFMKKQPEDFASFCEKEAEWLEDYALFMALKDAHGGIAWFEWEKELKTREQKALSEAKETYADDILFYKMLQYLFFKQWWALKEYVNEKGIEIIGDVPIYVAGDSADVWANPAQFYLDENLDPIDVAGCPPDAFSVDGQLWGNPLFRWDEMKKDGYSWWTKRIKAMSKLYDIVRIDHFRGFDSYYAIPGTDDTARNGEWREGPGMDLFHALEKKLCKLNIIVEDLGFLTPSVLKLVKDSGFPGMKVVQFAFDSREGSDYLPHNYPTHCVVYTGTHDNDTTMGWYQTLKPALQDRVRRYLNTDGNIIHYDMIRAAMGSIARYAIYPIQDLLGFGSDCRMNTPSVAGGNWAFRFRKDHLTPELAANLRKMTELFGRCEPLEPIEEEEGPEGSIKPGETAPGLAPEE